MWTQQFLGWAVEKRLQKRSFHLLWFTGLSTTGWEFGWHVSINDLADPDRTLARSLTRGQPSSRRAMTLPARPGVFPLDSHTVHRHPM